jgi:hypothetical protein
VSPASSQGRRRTAARADRIVFSARGASAASLATSRETTESEATSPNNCGSAREHRDIGQAIPAQRQGHRQISDGLPSLSQAARDAGIQVGRSQVRRILLAEKVRWRRTHSWATSTDPEFAPKGPRSWSSTPPRRRAPR